jgi:hypothetical protein
MIRFACPRCKVVVQQPESAAGTQFACPSCGQRLQIPVPPADKSMLGDLVGEDHPVPAQSAAPPQPPVVSASPGPASTPATPPPLPPAARPSRRNRDFDDDYEDDFPSIARAASRRGRYSQESAVKAATSGLICSLISLGLLLVTFVLWVLTVHNQHVRFGGEGEPLVVVILLVILGSFVLALLGIVFSSRGLDESNRYNRGQATTGLVCGIISMVIGSIIGLFFLCVGMVFWSIPGRW